MKFFLDYRFWVPLLLVACFELFFRLGGYDSFVRQDSHAGRSILVKRALEDLGHDRVSYVTIGDSRADLGINHRKVLDHASQVGETHINLAMPGSHQVTFGVLSDLLHKDLPNLKGAVFFMSAQHALYRFNGYYELGIVEPFRLSVDYGIVEKDIPFDIHEVKTYGVVSSFFQYKEDVRELILLPWRRVGSIFAKRQWSDVLAAENTDDFNICAIKTETPESCLESVGRSLKGASSDLAEDLNRVKTTCAQSSQNVPLPDGAQAAQLTEVVGSLLRSFSFEKKPIVVLVPEHSYLNRYRYSEGTHQWVLSILKPMADNNEIILLDYADRFSGPDECSYFRDLMHLNSAGMAIFTDELLDDLKVYYSSERGSGW